MKYFNGEFLNEQRKLAKFSASDLVRELERLNVRTTVQSVYQWETGKTVPRLMVAITLAKIFNRRIVDFIMA